MVEVTQVARDLIAGYLESINDDGATFGAFRRGQCDNHPHTQAFQAAYNAGRAELLAELNEPTEAMVEAGRSAFYRAVGYSTEGDIGDGIKDAFRAMIAKAGE